MYIIVRSQVWEFMWFRNPRAIAMVSKHSEDTIPTAWGFLNLVDSIGQLFNGRCFCSDRVKSRHWPQIDSLRECEGWLPFHSRSSTSSAGHGLFPFLWLWVVGPGGETWWIQCVWYRTLAIAVPYCCHLAISYHLAISELIISRKCKCWHPNKKK